MFTDLLSLVIDNPCLRGMRKVLEFLVLQIYGNSKFQNLIFP